MLPKIITKELQLLNNVLYLKCFLNLENQFCKMEDKTKLHLFYDCTKTNYLWNQLKKYMAHETPHHRSQFYVELLQWLTHYQIIYNQLQLKQTTLRKKSANINLKWCLIIEYNT